MNKWGIIGAMPSEVACIRQKMDNPKETPCGRFTFVEGRIGSTAVVLAQCGIGKVNAALTAQLLIDRFGVSCIVNTGIAGAMGGGLEVFDMAVSDRLVYHDFEMRFLSKYPPYLDEIRADAALVSLAERAFARTGLSLRCLTGTVASGDQFIEDRALKQDIVRRLSPLCVEMEGAAVGHACAISGVPFVVIRTVSDNAEENANAASEFTEEQAASHSAALVLSMLALAQEEQAKEAAPAVEADAPSLRLIESFCVNHDLLTPGLYVSRIDGDAVTYDLRMVTPNGSEYLQNAGLHTFEHLFATYVRSGPCSGQILYVGPMGCRTGFYFIVRDALSREAVIALLQKTMDFIASYEGEIPGAARIECGNYLDHDLPTAREYGRRMAEILRDWTPEKMAYRT